MGRTKGWLEQGEEEEGRQLARKSRNVDGKSGGREDGPVRRPKGLTPGRNGRSRRNYPHLLDGHSNPQSLPVPSVFLTQTFPTVTRSPPHIPRVPDLTLDKVTEGTDGCTFFITIVSPKFVSSSWLSSISTDYTYLSMIPSMHMLTPPTHSLRFQMSYPSVLPFSCSFDPGVHVSSFDDKCPSQRQSTSRKVGQFSPGVSY